MAITAMAPRSSAIANVKTNSFAPAGTRLPRSTITPTAKAMSVGIGIAQPEAASAPTLLVIAM